MAFFSLSSLSLWKLSWRNNARNSQQQRHTQMVRRLMAETWTIWTGGIYCWAHALSSSSETVLYMNIVFFSSALAVVHSMCVCRWNGINCFNWTYPTPYTYIPLSACSFRLNVSRWYAFSTIHALCVLARSACFLLIFRYFLSINFITFSSIPKERASKSERKTERGIKRWGQKRKERKRCFTVVYVV